MKHAEVVLQNLKHSLKDVNTHENFSNNAFQIKIFMARKTATLLALSVEKLISFSYFSWIIENSYRKNGYIGMICGCNNFFPLKTFPSEY